MANNFSDYLEEKILKHIWGGSAYTAPTSHGIGLWTTTLSDASTGATAGEVSTSGTAYARQALDNDGSDWTYSSSSVSNTADVDYPTATDDWGEVTDTMDTDSDTEGAGNNLVFGALTAAKTINSGDVFKFPAGDYVISLN